MIDELASGAVKVIALGGGAFVQAHNARLLEEAGFPTVFLEASVDELWRRCQDQASAMGAQRPLLQDEAQFQKLHQTRRKAYLKAPHKVKTGKRTIDEIAAEIEQMLGLKRIAVREEQGEGE